MDSHVIRSLVSGLSLRTGGLPWYTIFSEWIFSACRWTTVVYDLVSGLSLRTDGQPLYTI